VKEPGVLVKLPGFLCIIMVIFLWACKPCAAQVYKYVDEKGVPCYTDDYYRVPEKQRPDVDTVEPPRARERTREKGVHERDSHASGQEQRRLEHLSRQLLARAERGDVDTIKTLLERGADIHATDKQGETALMKAARLGNYPVVKLLIEHGANVNAIDATGATALGHATRFGQEDVADLLKTHGAVH
jgi:hypothetical protein